MPNPPNRIGPLRPSPGGAAPRRKGVRAEREIVERLRAAGIEAERVPLSGAAGGRFAGDVMLPDGRRAEVKIRRTGLALLYRLLGDHPGPVTVDPSARGIRIADQWLGAASVLFVRANRAGWLAIERRIGLLHVQTLEQWIAAYHGHKDGRTAA